MNYYEKAVKLIASKEKMLVNLGLERISKIMDALNNPQDNLKIIHIAGTNGKGSTASITAKILEKAGFKTGLYTSPHIEKYNERIKINGKNIYDKRLFELISEVLEVCKKNNFNLSEFELLTAIAFLHYEQEKIDFLVLETGLGGRLDATNVIKNPILTAITSISKDHTDKLGDTIEKISTEKAGIIKHNIPVIISPQNSGYETIIKIANSKKASIIAPKSVISINSDINSNKIKIDENEFEFALKGLYQKKNLELAIEIINYINENHSKISQDAIREGLRLVSHTGRFEFIKELNLIIDGAHNLDGAKAPKESLDKYFSDVKKCFIYASINTKDFKKILKTLINKDNELYLYDFKKNNAIDATEIQNEYPNASIINDAGILNLIKTNAENKKLTIITGSLYAIGDLHALVLDGTKYSPVG